MYIVYIVGATTSRRRVFIVYLVFSLLNCTVYVLEEALVPLRLPLWVAIQ